MTTPNRLHHHMAEMVALEVSIGRTLDQLSKQAAGHPDFVIMPLLPVALPDWPKGIIPANDGKLWITGVGDHSHQGASVIPFPTAFQMDEVGCFTTRGQQA